MIKTRHLTRYMIVIIAIEWMCCRSVSTQKETHESPSTVVGTELANKIAFYSFNVSKDKNQQEQIRLNDIKVVPGKLKSQTTQNPKPGSLRFTFTDSNSNTIYDQIIIEDPLNPTVEYTDDNNRLMKKIIVKSTAEVVIRIPYNPATALINIDQFMTESQVTFIGNLKIN